ncbi:MAG: hypothetical protein AB1304_06265 [Bacteroidota bacterium]
MKTFNFLSKRKVVAYYSIATVITVFINIAYSQNVSISQFGNPPNASAGLDVEFTNKGFLPPRVALTGPTDAVTIPSPATGLMVYNTNTAGGLTPGYYFNRGTPASPSWVPFSKQQIYHASSTSGVTINTNGAITLIPGTAITIVIPTGLTADIDIFAYSGASLTGGTSTSWAAADLIIYKDGGILTIGGWDRVKLNNRDGSITDMQIMSIISRDSGVTGTHTYDLRGNRYAGNQAIRVGGDCATQVNCAEMTIIVTYR